MTDPLTSPDLDLRDFAYMPLDVVRLRDSESVVLCSGDEFRAAVLLWCAAWHQVPAASLPKDERLLANLAGYGRDMEGWKIVCDGALRGFVECSDGRLYHPVIAEKAKEAQTKRKSFAKRGKAGADARWGDKECKLDSLATDRANSSSNGQAIEQPLAGDAKGIEGKGIEGKKVFRRVASATTPNLEFEEFWKNYPARKGDNPKSPARKIFEALVKQGADPGKIIAGVKAACARNRDKIGTEFIPQAVKWLRDRRFEDYAESPVEPAQTPVLDWDNLVGFYKKTGTWSKHAGCPEPGYSGCKAPADILSKYGYGSIRSFADDLDIPGFLDRRAPINPEKAT